MCQNYTRIGVAVTVAVVVAGVTLGVILHQRVLAGNYEWVQLAFSDPQLTQPAGRIDASELASGPTQPGDWTGYRSTWAYWTPVLRWGRVVEVRHNGQPMYVDPAARYAVNARMATPLPSSGQWGWLLVCTLGVALGVYGLMAGARSLWKTLVALLALRCASLAWAFAVFGFYTIHAGDESHYWVIANKLLDWSVHDDLWKMTLGEPLLLVPLAALMPEASEFLRTAVASGIQFVVFGIGAIWVLVAVLWRHFKMPHLARTVGALLVVFPWVFHCYHRELLLTFAGLRLDTPALFSSMEFYYFTDFVGFCAMTDTPAMFFALLSVFVLMVGQGRRGLLLAGASLGLACIIRPTQVFVVFAIVLLYAHIARDYRVGDMVRFIIGMAIFAMAQFGWNTAIFGNPFHFGHLQLPDVARGFEWGQLARGLSITATLHAQLLLIGALGLTLGTRQSPIVSALLALLFWPTFTYYSGYYAIGENPVRFVLQPIVAMIAATAFLWSNRRCPSERWHRVAVVVTTLLLVPGTDKLMMMWPLERWAVSLGFVLAGVFASVRSGFRWPYWAYYSVAAIGVPAVTYGYVTVACIVAVGFACRTIPVRERLSTMSWRIAGEKIQTATS